MTLKNKIFGHIYACALFVLYNSIIALKPAISYFLGIFHASFLHLKKNVSVCHYYLDEIFPGNQSTTKTLYQFLHSLQKAVVADALNSLVGEGERLDY